MDIRERLKNLIQQRCVLHGDFVLGSGARSSVYFDCKRATLDPEGVSLIGELLLYTAAALTLWSMWTYLSAAWPVMSHSQLVSDDDGRAGR